MTKDYRDELARFLMGTIFLVLTVLYRTIRTIKISAYLSSFTVYGMNESDWTRQISDAGTNNFESIGRYQTLFPAPPKGCVACETSLNDEFHATETALNS